MDRGKTVEHVLVEQGRRRSGCHAECNWQAPWLPRATSCLRVEELASCDTVNSVDGRNTRVLAVSRRGNAAESEVGSGSDRVEEYSGDRNFVD